MNAKMIFNDVRIRYLIIFPTHVQTVYENYNTVTAALIALPYIIIYIQHAIIVSEMNKNTANNTSLANKHLYVFLF